MREVKLKNVFSRLFAGGPPLLLGAALCKCAVLEPLPPLPSAQLDADRWGEFQANREVMADVQRWALRRPSTSALVEAQVGAMVEYVRRKTKQPLPTDIVSRAALTGTNQQGEHMGLSGAALELFPYLSLDTAPRELGEVAIVALRDALGNDAHYAAQPDEIPETVPLVPEVHDGLAILTLGNVDAAAGERIRSSLSHWGERDPKPRGVLLDLSQTTFEDVSAAGSLLGVFAPGKPAFGLVARNAVGAIQRRTWGGESSWGASDYAHVPIFVVTSDNTSSVAEALAHALRRYRGALVLGAKTRGTGRWVSWHLLPWNAAFGFTVADMFDSEGASLAGRPVIPDVCSTEQGLVRVPERTLEAYRGACGDGDTELDRGAALSYVQQLLEARESEPTDAAPELKEGERRGQLDAHAERALASFGD